MVATLPILRFALYAFAADVSMTRVRISFAADADDDGSAPVPLLL